MDVEIAPGAEIADGAALTPHIRRAASNYYLSPAPAAWGDAASGAVTDPHLRVHGVGGLRVADAAVMPSLVNGNTGAAAMMIAECAAELIAG